MSGTQLPRAGERAHAEAYQGPQSHLRSGGTATAERPRPLEFDSNGFPVVQRSPPRSPEFVARVDRLVSS
jgi:hypothetical protein